MAKRLNILAVALFVWALVLAPAAHRAGETRACESGSSCSHEPHETPRPGNEPPAKHDAAHCGVCQLAHAPALAAASAMYMVPDATPAAIPEFSFLAPAVPAACRLPFSCGPPA